MPPLTQADGETRTSRVIGSVDYDFPVAPPSDDKDTADTLTVVKGIRCAMPFTIKVGSNTGMSSASIEETAHKIFDKIETTFSTFNPKSEISVLNSLPAGEPLHMSDMLQEVILGAKEMIKLTRGAFDPSVGPLLHHYESRAMQEYGSEHDSSRDLESDDSDKDSDIKRRQREVIDIWKSLLSQGYSSDPSDSRVSQKVKRLLLLSQWTAAFSVGMYDDNGKIHRQNSMEATTPPVDTSLKIAKKHEESRLDLNGIAKGFAVDEITRNLPSPCYVEWGGDVKVLGRHPSGRPWQVAVPKPPSLHCICKKVAHAKVNGQTGPVFTLAEEYDKDDSSSQEYLAILDLHDGEAVATSGDSEKVVEKGGKLYSHIINPHIGRLLQLNDSTLAQAVVVSKSCMFADALATAAISVGDPSQARALLDPFRTGFREPIQDFLLYARRGPRIVRLSIPGVEPKEQRIKRLANHDPASVIVVGSGLAGMSAAVEAADARAKVIILEKEAKIGGNSAKATSGINGWGTNTQAAQKVADEERLFERDTHRSGKGGSTNPSLVRILSIQSAPAVHWLQKKFGIPLSVLSQLGGHSAKRTHRAPPDEFGRPVPIGFQIMKTMKDTINSRYHDEIEIKCGATVKKLLHNIDEFGVKTVTGVLVECNGETYAEFADSVVLATGGFGCCQSSDGLMQRFRPDLLGCPTTNGAFAQGDGVILGETVGAELIDMDKVQLHPTGFINPKDPSNPTKILAPEAIRGSGGVLVNSEGKRFINELDLRSVVTKAIQDNCTPYQSDSYEGPPFAWCIVSQEAQEKFGFPVLAFYHDKMGLFDSCPDISAVATLIDCSEETLKDTIRSYAEARMIGTCYQTNKNVFPAELSLASTDLLVARVTPAIHYTMGGISINAAGEVQEGIEGHFGKHRHIRGLYAAGEVTGGVHGGNRLAGNSLLECCVFGRMCGERAATVKQHENLLFPYAGIGDGRSESNWQPLVVREVINTDKKYGKNTLEVRFNMYGALQHSGLDIGQFVGLRGEIDGETLMGYFSPITRPQDEGMIGILCRTDAKGGPITKIVSHLRPGNIMHMCAMGGLRLKFRDGRIYFKDKEIRRIGLLAGGTGIAPMVQIIRAYSDNIRKHGAKVLPHGLNLIYAAEEESDLAYMKLLSDVKDDYPGHFRFYVKLNRPPLGWTEGVGFIGPRDVRSHLMYPPMEGDLSVICGPPIFESAMIKTLQKVGFNSSQYFSFSEDDKVSARSSSRS